MKLQKINYTETLIYKALEKLDMFELLERDNKSIFNPERNVPVRAAKTITLHRLNVQIPEGTLFFISRFRALPQFERTLNFELELTFPDEEETKKSGEMVHRKVPCNVDSNTYEIFICGKMPLSELIEKVDGETAETMKELYTLTSSMHSPSRFMRYFSSKTTTVCVTTAFPTAITSKNTVCISTARITTEFIAADSSRTKLSKIFTNGLMSITRKISTGILFQSGILL